MAEEEYPEESNTGVLGTVSGAVGSGFARGGRAIRNTSGAKIKKIMRIANAVNGGLVMTAGVVLLFSIGSCDSRGDAAGDGDGSGSESGNRRLDNDDKTEKIKDVSCPVFAMGTIGFYTVVFGFLLLAFELRWGEKYRARLYKYFGFIFGYFGRMVFIMFLATLCLALPSGIKNAWVGNTIVFTTLANGLFNCYVIYKHPAVAADRKAQKQQRKKGKKKGKGGGGRDVESGRSHASSVEAFSNPNFAMPPSRGTRGTMDPMDHPVYSTPAPAPAAAPAPGGGGDAFDDDNPFADDSVTGAM